MKKYGFGTSGRYDDVVRTDVYFELIIVFHELFAETANSFAGRVFQHFPVQIVRRS